MRILEAASRLTSLFRAPPLQGAEHTRRTAVLLHHLTNGILGLVALSAVFGIPFVYQRRAWAAALLTAVVLAVLVTRLALHRGAVRGAARFLLSCLWCLVLLIMAVGTGVADSNVAFMIALIVLAGLLLGNRSALVMAAATILALLLLALLEGESPLPLQFFTQPPLARWTRILFAVLMTVLILNEALRQLDESLRSARRESGERLKALEQLQESRELFTRIVNAVPDIIVRVGEEGKIDFVNDRALDVGGYAREELVGGDMLAFIAPEDRDRAFLNTVRMFEGQLGPIQYDLLLKEGRRLPVEVNGDLLRREDGTPYGAVYVCRNIGERRQVEIALRESEERYRTILEDIEEGYQEVDLKGNFTFFNDAFQRIFGYGREELLGSSFRRYAADEQNARAVLRVYREMFRTGVPIRRHSWDILNREGQRRTIEYSASILRDDEGRPTGFRGIVRDVTDRRQAEEQYRLMANNSQSGIYILTRGRFRFVNPHIIAYSEYAEEELLGEPSLRFVHPEDRAMAREHVRKMLAGETRSPHEYRIVTKSGKIRWLLGSVTWITYQGERAVLGDTMDITELREAREQLESMQEQLLQAQKLESLGTLAGGIAHDFNNLLMGIQGYASLMLLGMREDHPHHEKLKAIESQVQSGSELTRQLLGFARGGRYEAKPTDLNELLRKTAQMFGRTKKEIRIHEKYAEAPWTVEADRGQVEQVFLNLLVNAWQAMPGGGDLFLETANVELDPAYGRVHQVPTGRYVRVTVTDTGVGMDERTRQRIFDPFFTTKEMGRGAGLGLASVYGIVMGHGGFIGVESEPGRGASFTIHFPVSDRALEEEPALSREVNGGHETILVADDEDLVREVTREMLESLGYRVLTAQSGEEALDLYRFEGGRVDLVILDMIMPGMGGGEVYDALRSLDPEVRVILSSGYSIDGKAREIMKRGVREFLQKPFRFEDLSGKIRSVLAE